MTNLVRCKNCKWIQFKMSAAEVAKQAAYLPGSEEAYKKCFSCGGSYKNFRQFKKGEPHSLYGSTVQALLDPKSQFDVVSNRYLKPGEAYLIDPRTGEILLTFTNLGK